MYVNGEIYTLNITYKTYFNNQQRINLSIKTKTNLILG